MDTQASEGFKLVGPPESITPAMVKDAKANKYLLVTRVFTPKVSDRDRAARVIHRSLMDAGVNENDLSWIMILACPKEMSDYELTELLREWFQWYAE